MNALSPRKNWESSLWWSQRGIELYGENPGRPASVAALHEKEVARLEERADRALREIARMAP